MTDKANSELKIGKILKSIMEGSGLVQRRSTCDWYGWDIDEHYLMPHVARLLRLRGWEASCSVNHGVSDWVFVRPVDVSDLETVEVVK